MNITFETIIDLMWNLPGGGIQKLTYEDCVCIVQEVDAMNEKIKRQKAEILELEKSLAFYWNIAKAAEGGDNEQSA